MAWLFFLWAKEALSRDFPFAFVFFAFVDGIILDNILTNYSCWIIIPITY